MIKRIYNYALKTHKLCRILHSFLVFIKHAVFPKSRNICREDIVEDLRITCSRYSESVVKKNKRLRTVTVPVLVPFIKSTYGKCPKKCPMCNENNWENNRFEFKIYTPKNAKIDYHPGCMVIKMKNTVSTNRKYVVLVHALTDDIMASQGLDINHYASVLMFDDGMLVTMWAYHNEKGVLRLG